MNRIFRAAGVMASCASLGACATVVRGTNTNWAVSTSPSGASVRTDTGLACAATPCSLRVPRLAEFTATVSKPGFEPVDVHVTHAMSSAGAAALAGNVIVGGVPGIAIDFMTGAVNDITPSDVVLQLKPSGLAYPALYDLSAAGALASQPAPAGLARTYAPITVGHDDGRVVEYKLLPNGSVRETRE